MLLYHVSDLVIACTLLLNALALIATPGKKASLPSSSHHNNIINAKGENPKPIDSAKSSNAQLDQVFLHDPEGIHSANVVHQ